MRMKEIMGIGCRKQKGEQIRPGGMSKITKEFGNKHSGDEICVQQKTGRDEQNHEGIWE